MTDACPVCSSTKPHCLDTQSRKTARHLARERVDTAIDVAPRVAARIDALAARANLPASAVLEWAIWAALRREGVNTTPTIRKQNYVAWRRLGMPR
jgi:hypothetical protein